MPSYEIVSEDGRACPHCGAALIYSPEQPPYCAECGWPDGEDSKED